MRCVDTHACISQTVVFTVCKRNNNNKIVQQEYTDLIKKHFLVENFFLIVYKNEGISRCYIFHVRRTVWQRCRSFN